MYQLLSTSGAGVALLCSSDLPSPFEEFRGWSSLGFAWQAQDAPLPQTLMREALAVLHILIYCSSEQRGALLRNKSCLWPMPSFDLAPQASQLWSSERASITINSDLDACCNENSIHHDILPRLESCVRELNVHVRRG